MLSSLTMISWSRCLSHDGHHGTVIIWPPSCYNHHVTAIVWGPSCYDHYVIAIMWPSSCDRHHVTAIVWQRSCDRHRVTAILWRPSCDRHRVTAIMWWPSCDGYQLSYLMTACRESSVDKQAPRHRLFSRWVAWSVEIGPIKKLKFKRTLSREHNSIFDVDKTQRNSQIVLSGFMVLFTIFSHPPHTTT